MSSVRVHLAVLSIADPSAIADVSMENIVADRAVAAGHHIAAFTTVRDNEVAIRAQLVGLIMDPDIDVVIVVGEGEATSRALAPLVDQALPGFADLLRMLAFQEIGASAMLSSAEAARCESTFVFVLPAGQSAVSAAMDKLILPQLDPQTKPRNLIDSIPRLRDATKVDRAPGEVTRTDVTKIAGSNAEATRVDAVTVPDVPVAIAADKTTSGPGLAPKPPAVASRTRSRTGAHVIVRKVEDPTKPIQLAKLEQQIAMSQTSGEVTRTVDLGEVDKSRHDTPVVGVSSVPQVSNRHVVEAAPAKPIAAAPSKPIAAARSKPIPTESTKPLPSSQTQLAPVAPALVKRTQATSVVPSANRAAPPATAPVTTTPAVVTPVMGTPVGDAAAKPAPAKRPQSTSSSPVSVKRTQLSPFVPRPPASPVPASAATPPLRSTSPSSPPPAAARTRPPTAPPIAAPARVRQPTTPPPPVVTAPADVRQPTPPPPPFVTLAKLEEIPLLSSAELIHVPLMSRADLPTPRAAATASSDLPQGAFTYPNELHRSKKPLVIGLVALTAIAVAAMFVLIKRDDAKPAEVVAVAPIDAAASTPDAAGATDSADAQIAVVSSPIDAAQVATREPPLVVAKPSRPARPTKPRAPAGSAAESTAVAETPGERPTKPSAPSDPDCDEVACVLEKYARPCCARYKPTAETFQPKGGSENLDKAQIRAGVERVKPKVGDCGGQFKIKGTVKLAVTVTSEGTVDEVTVQSSPDDALGNCVAAVIRKARFAATVNGGSFTYPFVF